MPRKNKSEKLAYQREYYKTWYGKNRTNRIVQNRNAKLEYIEWYEKLKSECKCEKCGESHPSTIDFHHKDRTTKILGVANLVGRFAAKEKVLSEIAKCQVLCSNCHRKEHWNETIELRKLTKQKWLAENEKLISLVDSKKCKGCEKDEEETTEWKNRSLCRECYNKKQAEVMKRRRT